MEFVLLFEFVIIHVEKHFHRSFCQKNQNHYEIYETKYFPVNLAKFLRTHFLQNTSGWRLLFHIFYHAKLLLFQS